MAVFNITLQDDFSKSANVVTGALDKMVDNFKQGIVSGNGLSGAVSGMATSLDPYSLALKMAAANAALFVGAVGSAVAISAAMVSKTISLTQSAEATKDKFQALTGDGAGTAKMIGKLAKELPIAKKELNSFATELAKGGLKGKALEEGTKGMAAIYASLGEEGAYAMSNIIKKLNVADETGEKMKLPAFDEELQKTGLSLGDLAKQMNISTDQFKKDFDSGKISVDKMNEALSGAAMDKNKSALEHLGLKLSTMMDKAMEAWNSFFTSKELEPLVDELMGSFKSLFDIFTNGAGTARVMGGTIQTIVKALLPIITGVVKDIHLAIVKLIVIIAQIGIAIAPTVIAFKKFITGAVGIFALHVAFTILKATLIGLGVVAAALGFILIGAMIPVILITAVVVGAIILIGLAIYGVIKVIMMLGSAIATAGSFIWGFVSGAAEALYGFASSAVGIAGNFISGLVNGIVSGTGMVIDAVKNLANGAIGTIKDVLGIHSPSKVMMQLGGFTAEGMSQGIDAGSSNVENSANNLAVSAVSGASNTDKESNSVKSTSSGSLVVNVGGITISGVSSAAQGLEITEQQISLIFERVAMEMGLI